MGGIITYTPEAQHGTWEYSPWKMKIIFGAILTLRGMIFVHSYRYIYVYIHQQTTAVFWSQKSHEQFPWNLEAPTICSTGRHQTPCDLKTVQAFAVPGVFQTRYAEGFFPGERGWFCCNQTSKEQKMHETWDIISWRPILKLFIVWHHKLLKHAIPRPNDSTLLFVKWKNHHSSTVSNAAWQHITFCVTLTSVANMSHVFAAVAPTGFPAVHFLLSRAGPFVKFGHPCTGDIKWCYHDKLQPSWRLNQPIWNVWSSNWKSFPNRGEHNKYLKPPPSKY